ncbi:hypothetical protein, partial [Neptunomonas phycophila]|uniref:hypothetical protein n=1 Tax=Neptunomonas phycophila TaxID=1572645 RepID=UPI00351785A9
SPIKKQISDLKISKAGHCTNKSGIGGQYYGLLSLADIKAKKLYSAAAVFAVAQNFNDIDDESGDTTWVVIESFNDQFWVAIVSKGAVLIESTKLLSKEEALKEVEIYTGSLEEYRFVGSGCEAVGGESSSITLSSLLLSISPDNLTHAQIIADNTYRNILFVIMGVGLMYALYYVFFQSGMIKLSNDEEEMRRQQIADSQNIVDQYYADKLAQPTMRYSFNKMINVFKDKQVFDAPWRLSTINCEPTQGICMAVYQNVYSLPVESVTPYLGTTCDEAQINAQGSTANCTIYLAQDDYTETGEAGQTLTALTNQLITLASLGIETSISDPMLSQIPGGELADQSRFYNEGLFTLTGDYNKLSDVVVNSPETPWAKLNKFTITSDNTTRTINLTLSVEGSYVIY